MKKNFLKLSTILFVSLCSVTAYGQQTSKYKKKTGPEFRFGVTAGAT